MKGRVRFDKKRSPVGEENTCSRVGKDLCVEEERTYEKRNMSYFYMITQNKFFCFVFEWKWAGRSRKFVLNRSVNRYI